VTLNVASKGETLSATGTRASSGEAAAVAGDPSSVSGTTTPSGKPPLGCHLSITSSALGVPVGGKRFGRCQRYGKINDNWVGTNRTESWKFSRVVCSISDIERCL
jgi:hypothetical protein